MSRRRSTPWIHRWSRHLIGAIATVGLVLTAYLTITKLAGAEVGCIAGAEQAGCNDVLSSSYASLFGLPLPLFGAIAYGSMAAFALIPLAINRETSKDLRKQLEDWSWLFLLIGGTAMAVFSSYLMYLLAFKLQSVCLYCIGSAILSWSLLILTIVGRSWEDFGQLVFTGFIVAMVTLVGTLAVYANVNNPSVANGQTPIPQTATQPNYQKGTWEITTNSGAAEIALAEHLSETGAKKYGAFWCPHCHEQKQLFGKEAFKKVDYIECAVVNSKEQAPECTAAKIQSYPTWEINGELHKGSQTLEELAELSGYQGPTDFKYTLPGR
ncbi:vitamin K epoxide reductase family protein [Lusitaniella coriacea LEGE 07157]|uniref:Vitamin K epoxide reductase family protein n=1 Tax=Lusitaniella coriacea LEGE 07157 TaxID=945747 RepID=A0A8J7DYE9_9CYAN|nr:vitamin K epoxide reductase family protein [Lusitaniella coriacea]MBE9117759.1 vitamin K epoxide reductase family protein [Lusitaniella coriacea LEGE 07157]